MLRDGPYPWRSSSGCSRGRHLSNEAAAEFLENGYKTARRPYVILAHLSENNNLQSFAAGGRPERALNGRASLLANRFTAGGAACVSFRHLFLG